MHIKNIKLHVNNTLRENAKDLDFIMSGLLWNYYTNEPTDPKTDSEPFYLRRVLQEVHQMIRTERMWKMLYH